MKLSELLQPWKLKTYSDFELNNQLCNDSRAIQPGDVFLAYPGAASDGRRYIESALAKGAKVIIFDPKSWPGDLAYPDHGNAVAMPHLQTRLAELANRYYQHPSEAMNVIGVTGTNGKTTIAYQLAQAHQLLGERASYIGTIGQGHPDILQPLANTTPDAVALQRLMHHYRQDGDKVICMEVSSHALDQGRVDGVAFKQALFTNLTLDHLDYHQDMNAYAQAKAKLFTYPSLKQAIINCDDPYALIMQNQIVPSCQLLTYGIRQACDVQAVDWEISMNGTKIRIASGWGQQTIHINALGFFNIYNALAIYTSLLAQGYETQAVAEIMPLLKPAPGRMEIVSTNPCIIVDYAHTPDALQNVLTTLNEVKKNRLIVVFGCGGNRDKSKRPLMGKIVSEYADLAIVTSDNPRHEDPEQIIEDIMVGISKAPIRQVDRAKAIAQAITLAEPGDLILIAGKGHENYQEIGGLRHPFSDQSSAISALKAVKAS